MRSISKASFISPPDSLTWRRLAISEPNKHGIYLITYYWLVHYYKAVTFHAETLYFAFTKQYLPSIIP